MEHKKENAVTKLLVHKLNLLQKKKEKLSAEIKELEDLYLEELAKLEAAQAVQGQ